jgi:hypothetical protein
LFSESPPLSGDQPPTKKKQFFLRKMWESEIASNFAGRIRFFGVNFGRTSGFAKWK